MCVLEFFMSLCVVGFGLHDLMSACVFCVCIPCISLHLHVNLCMSVPVLDLCVRVCTYWQGFKEMFFTVSVLDMPS